MFKSKSTAFLIWAIASIFYAYQYVLRVMPSIMLDDIMNRFNFDAASYGQFSGIYYIGYSLMHLPIGILLDRVGPRKVMTSCIILTVIGLIPIIISNYWVYPIIGRLLMGIGSSAAILGTFKVIRIAFDKKHFTKMLSWAVTIGLLGAIYGGGPVNYMNEKFGYQMVIKIFAAIGVILAFITYIIIPNIPAEKDTTIVADIKEALSNIRVLMICILGGLMIGPLEGFADVWGPIFLKNVYGFDEIIAASMPSLIFIGMSIGAPLIGFIAEKTGRYMLIIISLGVIMAIGFTGLLLKQLPADFISPVFILIGICCSYQILVIYKASTFVREHVVSLTTAIANMIMMSFGYIVHTSMGSIIDHFGGRDNIEALTYGTSVIPIAIMVGVLGFICMDIIDKKRNRRKVEIIPTGN